MSGRSLTNADAAFMLRVLADVLADLHDPLTAADIEASLRIKADNLEGPQGSDLWATKPSE